MSTIILSGSAYRTTNGEVILFPIQAHLMAGNSSPLTERELRGQEKALTERDPTLKDIHFVDYRILER